MGLFRRGKDDPGPEDAQAESAVEPDAGAEDDQLEDAGGPVWPGVRRGRYDRSAGPWDISESERSDQDLPRLDLGSLLVPGLPGLALQVEADQESQTIMAVTAMKEEGAVQLQAYAAPKSEGLWDEIREEIRAEITAGPGELSEHIGPFGSELRALLPATAPDGRALIQPVRFVGIDGPRWFLRAVFLGRAAVEPDPEDDLHTLVRQVIVVRGPDAMAPKDQLPLRLPPPEAPAPGSDEPVPVAEPDDEETEDRFADLNPFERGPEITEIR